ncbi:MAG: hypothetical protein ACIAQZ_14960 [Sedimentisphaeraceae bacterium JB056]
MIFKSYKLNIAIFLVFSILSSVLYMNLLREKENVRSTKSSALVIADKAGVVLANLNFEKKQYIYYITDIEISDKQKNTRSFVLAKKLGFKIEKLKFGSDTFPICRSTDSYDFYQTLEDFTVRVHNATLIRLVENSNTKLAEDN